MRLALLCLAALWVWAEDCPIDVAQRITLELNALARIQLDAAQEEPAPLEPLADYSGARCAGLVRLGLRSPHACIVVAAIELAAHEGSSALADISPLAKHSDPLVRAAVVRQRLGLEGHAGLGAMRSSLTDREPVVRHALAEGLAAAGWPETTGPVLHSFLELLRPLASDVDADVREAALRCAASGTGKDAEALIQAACLDSSEGIALRAATLLRDPEAMVARLIKNFARLDLPQRITATQIFAELGAQAAVPVLLKNLDQRNEDLLAVTLDALRDINLDEAQKKMLQSKLPQLFQHKTWWVRASAYDACARHGELKALGLLIRGREEHESGRHASNKACQALTGQPFNDPEKWRAWLAATPDPQLHPGISADTASAVTFCSIQDRCASVVFAIDTSGSMAKEGGIAQYRGVEFPTKLNAAKRELLGAVMALEPGTRFNVIFFSSRVRNWEAGLVRASWRTKARLERELRDIEPRGATATLPALDRALAEEHADVIFFLTDGMPTVGERDPQRICARVSLLNGKRKQPARLHTIAFCIEEARDLLEPLASGNQGQYQMVE